MPISPLPAAITREICDRLEKEIANVKTVGIVLRDASTTQKSALTANNHATDERSSSKKQLALSNDKQLNVMADGLVLGDASNTQKSALTANTHVKDKRSSSEKQLALSN